MVARETGDKLDDEVMDARLRQGELQVASSEAYFAPPVTDTEGTLPAAIGWRSYWDRAHDGIAIASRRTVRALHAAGVPVTAPRALAVNNPIDASIDPEVRAEMAGIFGVYTFREVARVWHGMPTAGYCMRALYPGASIAVAPELVEGSHAYTVFMTVFESDRIPKGVADLMALFAQVWVPCRRNRDALLAQGLRPERVKVLPHPYDDRTVDELLGYAAAKPTKSARPLSASDPFVFLHIGKWEKRKDQQLTIRAFLRAFSPGEPVQLVLKCAQYNRTPDYPDTPEAGLLDALREPEAKARGWTVANVLRVVRFLNPILPGAKLRALYGLADAYVNASHAEGWDLPAFDAALAGCRLIHAGFGGSEDYAPANALRVWDGESLEPYAASYHWTGRWAALDLDRIALALRQAYDERQPGSPMALPRYSPLTVGSMARSYLAELVGGPDALERAFQRKETP